MAKTVPKTTDNTLPLTLTLILTLTLTQDYGQYPVFKQTAAYP